VTRQILFLCSANFYRSRFAEHYFNHLAANSGLAWQAQSRGLMVGWWGDVGQISRHTVERLEAKGIRINGDARGPQQVTEADLAQADLVVALKESEHRPAMTDLFPDWADQVEYWDIDDLDCAEAGEALPVLEDAVQMLAARLAEDPRLPPSKQPGS
jgi:protein-tyrosine phosphatase